MSTLSDVLTIHRQLTARAAALVESKGHDYAGSFQSTDTLFNLKVAAMLGIVPTPSQGILVRLSDKFMRLISLVEKEPAGKEESFEDTVVDVINYAVYLVVERRERTKG